ncbi:Uncharacterised protein [Acholeplasma oculi]|uniref:Uncharacterized protein n=1 Tax=Acholeplasma oculi TaxID=35623 RepID=A0A061AHA5_9MOLU|nr:hypothetical protein [Acholeplasma oculi]CDR30357.1 hypothetical protein Aocu_02840 [Acholeplasma oculi]SKC42327.1 hypothetical protein SAMN02745122_0887 [Acholeplasma oculi]SUT88862.1 Uncharacterised protein [Acholeplasma oculi]
MGFFFNEPNKKYAVINFIDSEGLIYKAVRCRINERIFVPTLNGEEHYKIDPITNDVSYLFISDWLDSNNQVVTEVIASGPYDYYADIYELDFYQTAVMETGVDHSQHMMANRPFYIYSNKEIYLKTTNYQGYTIEPSITHVRDSSGKIINKVSFHVVGLVNSPGQTTIFEPEFKIYKEQALIHQIGIIKFGILIVHSSSQPTGD